MSYVASVCLIALTLVGCTSIVQERSSKVLEINNDSIQSVLHWSFDIKCEKKGSSQAVYVSRVEDTAFHFPFHLQNLDEIVAIDDQPISSGSQLALALNRKHPASIKSRIAELTPWLESLRTTSRTAEKEQTFDKQHVLKIKQSRRMQLGAKAEIRMFDVLVYPKVVYISKNNDSMRLFQGC